MLSRTFSPAACPHDALCDLPRTPPGQWHHVLLLSLRPQQRYVAVGLCVVVAIFVVFRVGFPSLVIVWVTT